MNYQFSVKMKQVTNFCTHSSRITCVRRGDVEVAGLTVDREIRIRFLTLTACGSSDGKEVKDIFGQPDARV